MFVNNCWVFSIRYVWLMWRMYRKIWNISTKSMRLECAAANWNVLCHQQMEIKQPNTKYKLQTAGSKSPAKGSSKPYFTICHLTLCQMLTYMCLCVCKPPPDKHIAANETMSTVIDNTDATRKSNNINWQQ